MKMNKWSAVADCLLYQNPEGPQKLNAVRKSLSVYRFRGNALYGGEQVNAVPEIFKVCATEGDTDACIKIVALERAGR